MTESKSRRDFLRKAAAAAALASAFGESARGAGDDTDDIEPIPHAQARAPIGADGVESTPTNRSEVDRAAERAGWGRRAAADLIDAIAEDREPEAGMYAGRTVLEMTTATYASALSGDRVTWPMATRVDPLE